MSVLVARDTIPKGTKAEDVSSKVTTEQLPTKVVAEGAMSTMRPIAGQVSSVDLVPGEQLVGTGSRQQQRWPRSPSRPARCR